MKISASYNDATAACRLEIASCLSLRTSTPASRCREVSSASGCVQSRRSFVPSGLTRRTSTPSRMYMRSCPQPRKSTKYLKNESTSHLRIVATIAPAAFWTSGEMTSSPSVLAFALSLLLSEVLAVSTWSNLYSSDTSSFAFIELPPGT